MQPLLSRWWGRWKIKHWAPWSWSGPLLIKIIRLRWWWSRGLLQTRRVEEVGGTDDGGVAEPATIVRKWNRRRRRLLHLLLPEPWTAGTPALCEGFCTEVITIVCKAWVVLSRLQVEHVARVVEDEQGLSELAANAGVCASSSRLRRLDYGLDADRHRPLLACGSSSWSQPSLIGG